MEPPALPGPTITRRNCLIASGGERSRRDTVEIEDRVIIVAGAGGGLGTPIARHLAAAGARLVLAGRSIERLGAVGIDAPMVASDLRLPGAASALIETALEAHGRLDGVVNATGVVAFGPATETEVDTVEELFLVNTFLPVFLFSAAIPAMTGGGVLVNISGVVAGRPQMGMAAYSASKAAISAWCEAVRREVRRAGITFLDAQPGHTETELSLHPVAGTAPKFPPGANPDAVAERIVGGIRAGETHLGPEAF